MVVFFPASEKSIADLGRVVPTPTAPNKTRPSFTSVSRSIPPLIVVPLILNAPP